jgi:hypothetical protein
MILRLAAGLPVRPKLAQPHPLHRRDDEMRDVVLGQPVLQIGWQQKRLVAVERYVSRHPAILPYSEPKMNPTAC